MATTRESVHAGLLAFLLSAFVHGQSVNFTNFQTVCGEDVYLHSGGFTKQLKSMDTKVQCAKECACSEITGCYGFNFKMNSNICELLYGNGMNISCLDTSKKANSNVYITKLRQDCGQLECAANEFCVEHLTGGECKTVTHCANLLPEIGGSNIRGDRNNRSVGASLTYVCDQEDYYMIGGETAVCSENGTWRGVNGEVHKGCSVLQYETCTSNDDCKTVRNSECRENLCVCTANFYFVRSMTICVSDCKSHAPGRTGAGNIEIYPDGEHNVTVECDFTNGGNTGIFRRLLGFPSLQCNRPWSDFLQPFGSPQGNYWIGLNNLHALTYKPSKLFFVLMHTDGKLYVQYEGFRVGNSSTNFKMTVASHMQNFFSYSNTTVVNPYFDHTSSNTGLLYHNGMQFSTKDKDNDLWSGGNLATTKGPWWFKDDAYLFGNFFADDQLNVTIAGTDIPFTGVYISIIRSD